MPSVPKASVNELPSINCCYKIIFCVGALLSEATLGGVEGIPGLQRHNKQNKITWIL